MAEAFRPIYAHELSPSGRERSEPVSMPHFQAYAAEGHHLLEGMRARGRNDVFGQQHGVYTPPESRHVWPAAKHEAYESTREPWGGATLNPRTGRSVNFHEPDKHAVTVREPGQEPMHAHPSLSEHQFGQVMDSARKQYTRQLGTAQHHLGVFHDADTHQVDIDPVVVTGNRAHNEEKGRSDARKIAAATHAEGGAYHFASGEGFWPPHVRG